MKFCEHCGAELVDDALICVKCGCPTTSTTVIDANKTKLNAVALVGFILSMVSLLLPYIGVVTALAGMICSIIGLVHVKRKNERGKGFAIAGISVGAALFAFWLIIWVVAFFWISLVFALLFSALI